MNDEEFRAHLDIATASRQPEDWVAGIAALCDRAIRTISVHELNSGGGTCFGYALYLNQSEVHTCVGRMTGQRVFADSCFVRFLLQRGILRPADHPPKDGSIVLYFGESFGEPAFPLHAGRTCNGKVHSKWGSGPVFQHAITDVPARYGPQTRIYRPISPEAVEEFFLEYAEFQIGPAKGSKIVAHCRSQRVTVRSN